MVGSAIVKQDYDAEDFDYRKIQSNDYTQLNKVTTGKYLLSTKGLNSLYDENPFTEVRFDCKKPYHKRRLHLKTNTTDVLLWLLQRRSEDPKPPSCNTFTTLEGDNSYLGGDCQRWYRGKWGEHEVYHLPIWGFTFHPPLAYDLSLNYTKFNALLCDDGKGHQNFRNIGYWSYYVR